MTSPDSANTLLSSQGEAEEEEPGERHVPCVTDSVVLKVCNKYIAHHTPAAMYINALFSRVLQTSVCWSSSSPP